MYVKDYATFLAPPTQLSKTRFRIHHLTRQNAMTNKDDNFDPSMPDDDSKLPAPFKRSKSPVTMYLANENEIRKVANEIFGDEFSDDDRNSIIEESLHIRTSKQRIVLEHMRVGAAVATILKKVVSKCTKLYGANDGSMKLAHDRTYDFLEKTQGYGRNACTLYLRQYEVFCGNDDAITHLSATDMRALTTQQRSKEVIEAVVELRRANPDAKQIEVKQLIADLEAAEKRAALAEAENRDKDVRIAVLSDRADEAMTEAQDAKDKGQNAQRELNALREEMEALRESRDAITQEYGHHSARYNELMRDEAKTRRELDELADRYKRLQQNPETVEQIVEKVPDGYTSLSDAMNALTAKLKELEKGVAEKKATVAELDAKLAQANIKISAVSVVRDRLTRMVAQFSAFATEFNAAQLAATIEGDIKNHKSIVRGIADMLKKYVGELEASLR